MKNFFLLLFGLALFQTSYGQNTVKGNVTDQESSPIYFATVAIFNMDSSIAYSASTDEQGDYIIEKVNDGFYYIEVTMLGYTPSVQPDVTIGENKMETYDFVMNQNNLLETVEIKSRRPLLEQYADKLVVNVAENITSLNTSLKDVMKKIPGVIMTGDRMMLAGSTNVTILINGKTTRYMDMASLLKDMPGDNIQKVEIIHQPGAEFDASGTGPVINIIMKKNALFGTFGTVSLGLSNGLGDAYKTGLNMSHYQGSVNINAGIGYKFGTDVSSIGIDRLVEGDRYLQKSNDLEDDTSLRGNLSVDWDITDKHRLGVQTRYTDYNYDESKVNTTEISFSSPIYKQTVITDNVKEGYWKLRGINPYYEYEIDTSGQKIIADFNYLNFFSDSENTLKPYDKDSGENFTNLLYVSPGDTKIYVGKVDYIHPYNKFLTLRLGTKYSLADLDNDLQSQYLEGGSWVNNASESNHYLFEESVAAAYTKLSYKKDAWAGTLGLRYEDSESTGKSVGIDTTITYKVSKLFPSASLSRDIISGLKGIFSYSYRLNRPSYSNLNPFRYAIDQYTSERGNPNLNPEFTHSMKFSLAYENQPFFNVEYKRTKDAMVDVIEQDDDTGIGFQTTANLDRRENLNINIGLPLDPIPYISGYVYFAANKTFFDADYLGELYDDSKWGYVIASSMEFTLPGDINTEISGWYTTGGLEGLLTAQWMYGTSIGMSKRFLDDKLKVSIGMDDPFNRFFYGDINHSNVDATINQTWDHKVFNVQASYKFGNKHLKSKRRRNNSASEEMNRAGKN